MSPASPMRIHADIPPIVFDVPAGTEVLTVPHPAAPLAAPTRAIAQALLTPRGTPPLAQSIHELELLQRLPGPRDSIAALLQRPVVHKDQWEVEMWCKVLEQVGGPAGLIYCTTGISPGDLEKLPLTSGYAYTGETSLDLMVQRALERILAAWQQRLGRLPWLGVIRDGAHAIPQLIEASRTV